MPKIMLVDDDYTVKLELEAMLISMGYDVIGQADSGEQAVEMAINLKPDLILMDIVMPGSMDGISAAEKIRSELGVAVVFLTGYGNREYVERAKLVEPFGYVMKPFTDYQIRASVELAIYKKEMERKLRDSHAELSRLNSKLEEEIEERKNTEQELKESEEKYRSLFENTPIGIATLDEDRNVLDFNAAMLRIYGYTREDPEPIGNTSKYYYYPEEKEKVAFKLSKNGFVKKMEVKLKRKDGTPYDALLDISPIEIGGKSLWHAMIQDISDRKRAEDELRKSRREWESIFQAIGHPTLILSGDQRLIHANKAAEKTTGIPEKDLIGKRCYEVFHKTEKPPKGCAFERMAASGRLETFEMEIEALGGSFLVSCTPMLDEEGRLEKVIHIATDITKQKKAQEALKKSECLLNETQMLTKVGGWEYDVREKKMTWTDQVYRIHGVSREGYDPNDLEKDISFYSPEERKRIDQAFTDAWKKGRSYDLELQFKSAKGEDLFVRTIGNPVLENGKVMKVVGNIMNITESKKLREMLHWSEKMEAIGTLTAGIAHDYNNLLAIIMGNLSLVQEETAPQSITAEFLHEIQDASSKAKDLTHRLMTFSKGGTPRKNGVPSRLC